jgi:phosphohistidine phosphatase SixA
MLHIVSAITFAAGVASATLDSAELRRDDLMAALRSGGYTVILRHARTDRSFQEQMGAVPEKRSEQRNLSDDGFRDAALMGVVLRKYNIAFAEIISSPMFRATETAEMAAGKPTTVTMALRVFPATPEQAKLVMTPPKKGTNRLLVTHHFVIETHVPGIKPGEIGESEAAIVRHTADGKVELVGRITLDDWEALANPNHGAAHVPAPAPAAHGGTYAPTPANAADFPDTHAGHLAKDYVSAFNSGNAEKMRAFIEASMLPDPARPTDERLKSYAKLFGDHGPLSLIKVDSSAAVSTVLVMKSKQGDLRLSVKSSEANPMRVSSVTFTFMQPGAHR